MAAGKPIFGMIDGSAMDVIKESNCGGCVSSDDIDSYTKLLEDFITNRNKYIECGMNGRKYFVENFKKDVFIKNLEDIINNLE